MRTLSFALLLALGACGRSRFEPDFRPALEESRKVHHQGVEAAVASLGNWFDDRKGAPVRAFVGEILSLKGMTRAVCWSDPTYQDWVARRVKKHLFNDDVLREAAAEAAAIADRAIRAGDGGLRVALARLAEEYHRTPDAVVPQIQFPAPEPFDVRADGLNRAGLAVGAEILGLVLGQAAILLIGAESGLVTFGIGLAVAIVIDLAVSWYAESELVAKIQAMLDQVKWKAQARARAALEDLVRAHEAAQEKAARGWLRNLE